MDVLLIGWVCAQMACTKPDVMAEFTASTVETGLAICEAHLKTMKEELGLHGYCIDERNDLVEK